MNREQLKIEDLGEINLIEEIEAIISDKMGIQLIRDDCFFYSMENFPTLKETGKWCLIFNTDMLVSTTDAPSEMSYYQIGKKAVIMNLSDLVVKGVQPKAIMISLGLNRNMLFSDFRSVLKGIVDTCVEWKVNYLGGDINETGELIISPTVFGMQEKSKIITREGIQEGDIIAINGKFGLTGVGFDILLNKKGSLKSHVKYQNAINSVLEPKITGKEALILAENKLVSSSIDSSDGLAKSIHDLMISNSGIGFEIYFEEALIDEEAKRYAKEHAILLEDLIFNAGEEFIHIFTIPPRNLKKALAIIKKEGGTLLKIGKIISEKNKIYVKKGKERMELKSRGFIHLAKLEGG